MVIWTCIVQNGRSFIMNANDITTIFSTWHIVRAAGLTAYLLLFVISACGLLISLRLLPLPYRTAAMAIHKTASQSCVILTLIHVLLLLGDDYTQFTLADVLIPLWADDYGAEMATGILAFDSLLLITIFAIPVIMKKVGNNVWRKAHYLALPVFWLTLYHGFTAGTDTKATGIMALYLITGAAMMVLCGLKAGRIMKKGQQTYEYSPCRR